MGRGGERPSDLVVALDGEGTIIYANPAVQLWLGADPDLIVGTNVLEWVYPDDMERAIASMAYGALTIVAREAGHHELVDRVLESMVADSPFEEILVESATLMCRRGFRTSTATSRWSIPACHVGCCTPPSEPNARHGTTPATATSG